MIAFFHNGLLALQVPRYVERTVQLASAYGGSSSLRLGTADWLWGLS